MQIVNDLTEKQVSFGVKQIASNFIHNVNQHLRSLLLFLGAQKHNILQVKK